jgi:hypothetical protein
LLEQIQREQVTSQALREQLDETYQDLKKVVEEKRKLYKKLSKSTLLTEEQEYMKHFNDKHHPQPHRDQAQHPPPAPQLQNHHHHHHQEDTHQNLRSSRDSLDRTNYEQHHNNHATSHIMRALSSTVNDVDMHLQQAQLEEGLKLELKVLDDQIGKCIFSDVLTLLFAFAYLFLLLAVLGFM